MEDVRLQLKTKRGIEKQGGRRATKHSFPDENGRIQGFTITVPSFTSVSFYSDISSKLSDTKTNDPIKGLETNNVFFLLF